MKETQTQSCGPEAESGLRGEHKIQGVVIGVLTGIDLHGQASVAYAGNPSEMPVVAKSTVPLEPGSVGREVALVFEEGDPLRPILIGLIQHLDKPPMNDQRQADNSVGRNLPESTDNDTELLIDGERVDIQAQREIVLRCGKSSITMTRAGKVIIRGAYISTRSSGVNRIKGGSIQLN